jgi:hypothetical protein
MCWPSVKTMGDRFHALVGRAGALAVCARRAFAALRCFGRADEVIE